MYFPEANLTNILIAVGTLLTGVVLTSRELNPSTQMGYSKFTKPSKTATLVPSKQGMLIIYLPSVFFCFFGCVWSLSQAAHVKFVALFSLIHFLKRIYEVLYVHRYSGQALLKDNIVIACTYSLFSLTQLYFTSLVPSYAIRSNEMMMGIFLFFFGEGLNHYHHLILANLRKDGVKEYKIPRGGLFDYIWCPHYLGEIISFVAMVLLSQHMLVFVFQLCSGAYLTVRAYNTRLWYQQKFSQVPKKACLVPGLL